MPNQVSGTKQVIEWIAQNVTISSSNKAYKFDEIKHSLNYSEYQEAVLTAKKAGLTNLDIQGY